MSDDRCDRRRAIQLALGAVAGVIGAQTFGEFWANAAVSENSDSAELNLHPGPVAWIEEHWDVKPSQLAEFVAAYDANLYALARQTPGYRGYTVLTSVPATAGEPKETTALGGPDALINRHPAVRLMGEQLTERSLNWDALIGRAFNVLIIHHIQTWPDADAFRHRLEALNAAAHPDASLGDQLAKTVYPHANNCWEAEYRMVQTGWPAIPINGSHPATDADGLNLTPREAPLVLVGEHWDVKPERFREWLEAYERIVYSVIRRTSGYRGYSIATTIPPQPWEGHVPRLTRAAARRLGGDDALYVRRPGVMMEGTIRTDVSINVGALYKRTFNVILMHEMRAWSDTEGWFKRFSKIYADEHGGQRFTDAWAAHLMPNANNHWDTFFRVLKTSFAPQIG